MSQPNGSSRLDRIERALESHDLMLTRIETQQLAMQASLRDLESIVGTLAKTVDEFIRTLGASGRINEKQQS